MKFYLNILCITLWGLIGCLTAYSQPRQYNHVFRTLDNAKILDSANMRISYSLVFVSDSSKPNEKMKNGVTSKFC